MRWSRLYTLTKWPVCLWGWLRMAFGASAPSVASDAACLTSPASPGPMSVPASGETSPTPSPQMPTPNRAALIAREVHQDNRGWLYEAWRSSGGIPVAQATLVGCNQGIWKGGHRHPAKSHLWYCAGGRLLARVGDRVVPLTAGDGVALYIPAGVLHDVVGLGRRNTLLELDSAEWVEGDKVMDQ